MNIHVSTDTDVEMVIDMVMNMEIEIDVWTKRMPPDYCSIDSDDLGHF